MNVDIESRSLDRSYGNGQVTCAFVELFHPTGCECTEEDPVPTPGHSWYFQIHYDDGEGPVTSMRATLSKQYDTYTEAVLAMNEELVSHVSG